MLLKKCIIARTRVKEVQVIKIVQVQAQTQVKKKRNL